MAVLGVLIVAAFGPVTVRASDDDSELDSMLREAYDRGYKDGHAAGYDKGKSECGGGGGSAEHDSRSVVRFRQGAGGSTELEGDYFLTFDTRTSRVEAFTLEGDDGARWVPQTDGASDRLQNSLRAGRVDSVVIDGMSGPQLEALIENLKGGGGADPKLMIVPRAEQMDVLE
ncbi:MAG: hypothetical protein ACYTGG_13410 [Planctomycetota bacterium]